MNELQIQNEIRNKILLNTKALIKDELFDKAFLYLTNRFFDNLDTDNLNSIDKFNVCQAIFLSLQQGLLDEESFENLSMVKRVYKILYHKILRQAETKDELDVLYESNNFYCQKLEEIIKTNNK